MERNWRRRAHLRYGRFSTDAGINRMDLQHHSARFASAPKEEPEHEKKEPDDGGPRQRTPNDRSDVRFPGMP